VFTPADIYSFIRFTVQTRAFLRERITADEAVRLIREGMRNRDTAFLKMVDDAIYAQPGSPYLKLLKSAGIEAGDIVGLVRQEGLEGALLKLFQAGVYVTFEEFKGWTPAVRGSGTFTFRGEDFDNPLIRPHFRARTGGTRGRAGRVPLHLDHIDQSAPHWAAWFASHGWTGRPIVFWSPVFAAVAMGQLRYAKIGQPFVRWFSMQTSGSFLDRLAAGGVHGAIRWAAGFPKPEPVSANNATEIAVRLDRMLQAGVQPLVNTSASAAARVSVAALERGISLNRISFLLRGEPLTRARRATIESSGAGAVQTYGFSEGGTVGSQCPHPATEDDVHVFMDAFAVVGRPLPERNVPDSEALLFTALRPACPKVMLNAEIGDSAVIRDRKCGCLLGELGYHRHLSTIRSFEKLTGDGVTFAGSDIFHLIEDVLPRKFGGSIADYQLVESQDERGLPRCLLLVSPGLGNMDETAIVATVLEELGKMKGSYRLMASLWRQSGILKVERRSPPVTARGKVLPFRVENAS